MMKKLLTFLVSVLLFLPATAFAVTSVPWSITNLTDAFIFPNLVNGNAKGIIVSASSTVNSTLSVSSLTAGNCVQAGVGGLLTTIVGACGTSGGSITAVTATYPILSSGGTSPNISTAFGTTTSNTFAGTQTFTNSPVFSTLSAGTVNSTTAGTLYSTATSTPTVTAPITYSGTLGSFIGGISGTFACTNASAGVTGCLTGTDYNTFNAKQPAGNYITALTGDVTASGPGSAAATLATVNGNVGSFTYASITVNGKGLITAASNGTTPEVPLTFTWPLIRSSNTVTFGGLSTTSNLTPGFLPYVTGVNTFGQVATTTVSCGSGTSCSSFVVIGSSPVTITATGGSGSGNVSTSSAETSGRVPFWTSTSATPALLSGGVAGFTWNNTNTNLAFTYGSTTALSVSGLSSGNCVQAGTGGILTTTGSACSSGGGSAYPFPLANNATSTLTGFNAGLFSGWKVGIGTSTPFAALSIQATSTTESGFGGTGLSYLFAIGSSTKGTSTTTLFTVDNTGAVIANATSPVTSAKLFEVQSSGADRLVVFPTAGSVAFGPASSGWATFANGSTITIGRPIGDGTITSGTETLEWNNNDTTVGARGVFFIGTTVNTRDVTLTRLSKGTLELGNGLTSNALGTFVSERLGLGTTSPFALLSVVATSTTGSGAPTTLFAIASTTGGTSTSTLFSVDNTGSIKTSITGSTQCLHVDTNGVITGTSSDCGSGGSSFGYPFPAVNKTATTSPIMLLASTTIGNGLPQGGLTVNGDATTTGTTAMLGTAYTLGLLNVGATSCNNTGGIFGVCGNMQQNNGGTFYFGGNLLWVGNGNYNILAGNSGLDFNVGAGGRFSFNGGPVGIGTTTPIGAQLVLASSTGSALKFTDGSNTSTQWNMTNFGGVLSLATTSAAQPTATSTVAPIQISSSATTQVGIASTTPWRTLDVKGTVALNGLTSATGLTVQGICLVTATQELVVNSGANCSTSSARFKHNIQALTLSGIDMVNAIQLVTFERNDAPDKSRIGFTAENVAGIDSRLAGYDNLGLPNSVDDEAVLAVAIKAIQDQQKQINSLGSPKEENWQWVVIGLLVFAVVAQQVQIRRIKNEKSG